MNLRKLLPLLTILLFCSSSPTGPSIDPARKIAYVIRNPAGSNEDGRPIYNAEIYLVNSDGSETLQLTDTGWNEDPQFSPDGTQIAFVSDRDGNEEIYVMNVNGSNQKRLTNSSEGKFYLHWSPDGSQIAYKTRGGTWNLYIMNSDGSNLKQITFGDIIEGDFNWSHDGSQFVFTEENGNEIYTINTDGSNLTRLTFNNVIDEEPSFSPDDSKIVWRSQGNISIMNSDGTDQNTLTAARNFDGDPSFSPDGNRIMYFSVMGRPGSGIYLIDPDGSNDTLLVSINTGSNFHKPLFSIDGKNIVYLDYATYFLMIISSDGSNTSVLATGENGDIGWTYSLSPIW